MKKIKVSKRSLEDKKKSILDQLYFFYHNNMMKILASKKMLNLFCLIIRIIGHLGENIEHETQNYASSLHYFRADILKKWIN